MAETIGEAWVAVKPKTDNFAKDIEHQAGGALTKVGDKLSGIGTKMTAFVTAPVLAGGVAMFKMAADAEDATSAMNVVFGDSGKVIEKWSKDAATGMGMTSTEAKKAATDLAIFGKAGGLAGKDLTEFATQQSQLSADLASFKGTSVEEAMTAIGAAYRGEMEPIRAYGVLLDQQKIKEEAVALGLVSSSGELDNNAKLMATRSLIMKATADQQGDFARTSDGAANKMKILTAQLKEQATAIGVQLIPIGQKLLGFFTNLLTKFNELGPAGKTIAIAIGAVAIALGPLLFIVGKFMTMIPVLTHGLQLLGYAWLKLSAGFAITPFGIVIIAIGALVAAFIYAYQHSEKFREIVQNAIQAVSAFVSATIGALVVWWKGIWPQVSEAVGHAMNLIRETISTVVAVIAALWRTWGDDILTVAKGIWTAVSGVISGAAQVIGGIIRTVLAIINGDWKAAGEGLKAIVRGIWTAIEGIFGGAVGVIKGIVGAAFAVVQNTIVGAINAARSGVGAAVSAIIGFFSHLWNQAVYYVNKIKAAINSLPIIGRSPSPVMIWAEKSQIGVSEQFALMAAKTLESVKVMEAAMNTMRSSFGGMAEDSPGWNAATMGNRTGYQQGKYYVAGREVDRNAYLAAMPSWFYRPNLEKSEREWAAQTVVLQLDGRELGRVVTPYITDQQIVTGQRTQVGVFGGHA
jgi:hypothetical protein